MVLKVLACRRCRSRLLRTPVRRLVHLDWNRNGVADNWRHGWGVWRRRLGRRLLLDSLQLLDGDAWQNRLNDQKTVWGVARLDGALGQVNSELFWNEELAQVVAGDLVLLVLDFSLSLNGDASLLGGDFNLDLLWLVALDVEAQVQVARAIGVDGDWVDEGVVFDNVGWAENNVTELVWQNVASPVVHFAEHWVEWHHVHRRWAAEFATEWHHPVVRRHGGHWVHPVGHWPVGHWPAWHAGRLVWHHWVVRHVEM